MGLLDHLFGRGRRVTEDNATVELTAPKSPALRVGKGQGLGARERQEDSFAICHASYREALEQALGSLFSSHLEKLSAKIGRETRDALEREVLLKAVDMAWMDHIDNMDQLKQGIGLRSYGQNDPVKEYTKEGFAMFDEMVQEIQENTIRTLLRCQADS